MSKLDANDRTHAAIIGLKRGIIELVARKRAASPYRPRPERVTPATPPGVASAPPRRIIVSRYVLRRLYSTFAGGWPGIGLLLMRLVVGAVLLVRARWLLWSGPPLRCALTFASLAGPGLLLIAGLWTPWLEWPSPWSRSPQILTSDELLRAPSGSNDRGGAGDARTGPLVDRRPALRMEAHRSTSARTFERRSSASPQHPACRHARHPNPPTESPTRPEERPEEPESVASIALLSA